MSFLGDLRHTPAAIKPPAGATSSISMGGGGSDPLKNLSTVQARIGTLQKFLRHSVNSNTLIGKDKMEMVSAEISSAIHQIIVNGATLLASTQTQNTPETFNPKSQRTHENTTNSTCDSAIEKLEESKAEAIKDSEDLEEIIELDAVELLAEHVHFCEICGKGFKRDANLRMHMRAHGDRFKTPEALAKPDAEKCVDFRGRKTRFSCPFVGCNRNKQHKKFRPLKSVICVKNHFKRSHCPKMYSCTRCNKKSFSVLADLKSHLKHCGETKWKCSCGTSFSRKDKLFGHMALFEGHMPAVMATAEEEKEGEVEDQKGKGVAPMVEDEDEVEDFVLKDNMEMAGNGGPLSSNNVSFEEFLDGFGSIDNFCFQDVLVSPNGNELASGVDGLFNY